MSDYEHNKAQALAHHEEDTKHEVYLAKEDLMDFLRRTPFEDFSSSEAQEKALDMMMDLKYAMIEAATAADRRREWLKEFWEGQE